MIGSMDEAVLALANQGESVITSMVEKIGRLVHRLHTRSHHEKL